MCDYQLYGRAAPLSYIQRCVVVNAEYGKPLKGSASGPVKTACPARPSPAASK